MFRKHVINEEKDKEDATMMMMSIRQGRVVRGGMIIWLWPEAEAAFITLGHNWSHMESSAGHKKTRAPKAKHR